MEAACIGNAAAAAEISMLGNHPVTAGRLRESLHASAGLKPTVLAENEAPIEQAGFPLSQPGLAESVARTTRQEHTGLPRRT